LDIGQSLFVAEAGMRFHSSVAGDLRNRAEADSMEALFDSLALTGPLIVRNFRRGDRFQPLGMSGHKKIKDLFIEKKIPLSVRTRYPLLIAGEEILWIPGLGRSSFARVTERTTAVVELKAVRVES
jgi:tRNA(Ile)-lysidine synthase